MKDLITKQKNGIAAGICSICSAHPWVIEAALRFSLNTTQKVLIEATSNQVNQFGGYTGMDPQNFKQFVFNIAQQIGFPHERIILGGDHLGPNCWQHETVEQAMAKAEVMVADYVKAGFSKIHLDASMSCAGDPIPLAPDDVAQRSARLCLAAEQAANPEQKRQLSYVIGTEVPVPGGEAAAIHHVHVTTVEDTDYTISSHHRAFTALGLTDAWQRVIAVVVQPGVEFDHSQVIHYQPKAAQQLSRFIESTPLLYEAHSTDYQTKVGLKALVQDHFAILKVGPALTFALREAIFALSHIEDALIAPEKRSCAATVLRQVMLDNPQYWQKYYLGQFSQLIVDLDFSLSDRSRYYWPNPRLNASVKQLTDNLSALTIPLGLLSQYMPKQYQRRLSGQIESDPHSLIIDKIQDVIRDYAYACEA